MTEQQCSCGNEDVERPLYLTESDIRRAIEDGKPAYFPHKDRGIVFSVHAVPEEDVHFEEEVFWIPDEDEA